MPNLEGCIRDVVGKGNDEASATAICKASMQLKRPQRGPRQGLVLAIEGKGYVHPTQGKFDISGSALDEMVANFSHLGRPVPVYFGHVPRALKSVVPAAAFILSVARHGDRVAGIMEFSTEGHDRFKGGGFRGFSPELLFEYQDQKGKPIGTVLDGGAITNIPFLGIDMKLENDDTGKRRYSLVGSNEWLANGCYPKYDLVKSLDLEAGEVVLPAQFTIFVSGIGDKENRMDAKHLELLGAATEDEVGVKLEAMVEENKRLKKEAERVGPLDERVKSLETTMLTNQNSDKIRRIKAAIQLSLDDGKGSQRLEPKTVEGWDKMDDAALLEHFEKKLWFGGDVNAFERFATTGPVVTRLGESIHSGTPKAGGFDLHNEVLSTMKAKKLTYEDAMDVVRGEHPEEAKAALGHYAKPAPPRSADEK
jgi:hypothetical protein